MSGNPGDIDIFSSNHNNMANERAQESMEDVLLEIFDDTNVLRDQIDHLDECLLSMLVIETSLSITDDVNVFQLILEHLDVSIMLHFLTTMKHTSQPMKFLVFVVMISICQTSACSHHSFLRIAT